MNKASGIAGEFKEFLLRGNVVELAVAGRIRIEELITQRYDLDEADEAFRSLAAGEQARGLIVF